MKGTPWSDWLFGTDEADQIDGGCGNDLLVGQGGDDRLDGGKGHDLMVGGAGADTFVFSGGWDMILDFEAGMDGFEIDPTLLAEGQTLQDVMDNATDVCGGGKLLEFGENDGLLVWGGDLSMLGDSMSLMA